MEAPHSTTDVDLYHLELAERYGVKLPRRNSAPRTGNQAHFLALIGLTWGELAEWTGERRGEYFPNNPGRNCRDWAGEVLEGLAYLGFEPRPRRVRARRTAPRQNAL